MRIAVIGGGPAGLYFAISMKLREPRHGIHVFERNRADSTFGWGVVFSDQTVENLMANDPVSGATIRDEFAHWDDIDVHIHGQCLRSSGHGFIGIGRKRLLEILQGRARALGVKLHFEQEADPDLAAWADYDLVIAADGANSRLRERYAGHFGVDVQVRRNKFFWFGTPKAFEAFTFAFEQLPEGWVWAHAYRFDSKVDANCPRGPGSAAESGGPGYGAVSTFIVETSPNTWSRLGLDRME
ncbi:MAG: bifunctional salicylyl-CoA 5-hydroxylase/oxidoreductase, partial [Sphingosinicella sp.]